MTLLRLYTISFVSGAIMSRDASAAQSSPGRSTVPAPVAAPAPLRDGRHDFDFLHGTWRIHNRVLRKPLTGSNDWDEFEGRSVERPLWGGQANLEEYEATRPDGTPIHGLALRLYDPNARRWTIHWSNAANGTIDPPMTGTFSDGVGEFLSHEDYKGRMILVRFHWTNPAPGSARWEQAFSADRGRSWETNWIMEFTRTGDSPRESPTTPTKDDRCCPVIELRQYTLHPGQRETLIGLFDREFIDPQEALGMTLVGQFRDLDRPDVFTWIRGFRDMESRPTSLEAFYSGPVWARHREAANATMVSSDNVRLLHPVPPGHGFAIGPRAAPQSAATRSELIVATIYTFTPETADGFGEFFDRAVRPILKSHGADPIAVFETERSANNFPRLPVREGERAFLWFARFGDEAAHERFRRAVAADRHWTATIGPALERRLAAPVEVWRLTPTAGSRELR